MRFLCRHSGPFVSLCRVCRLCRAEIAHFTCVCVCGGLRLSAARFFGRRATRGRKHGAVKQPQLSQVARTTPKSTTASSRALGVPAPCRPSPLLLSPQAATEAAVVVAVAKTKCEAGSTKQRLRYVPLVTPSSDTRTPARPPTVFAAARRRPGTKRRQLPGC